MSGMTILSETTFSVFADVAASSRFLEKEFRQCSHLKELDNIYNNYIFFKQDIGSTRVWEVNTLERYAV